MATFPQKPEIEIEDKSDDSFFFKSKKKTEKKDRKTQTQHIPALPDKFAVFSNKKKIC